MQKSKKSKTKLLYENLWKQRGVSHYYGLAIYIFKSNLRQKKKIM